MKIPFKYLRFLAAIVFYSCVFCFTSCLKKDSPSIIEPVVSPPDTLKKSYQVLSNFNANSGKDWKLVYGSGSLAEDTEHFLKAPFGTRLISGSNTSNIIEKTLSQPVDACGEMNLSIKFWATSVQSLATVGAFSITLVSSKESNDTASTSFHHQVRNPQLVTEGRWTTINVAIRSFNRSTTFNCMIVSRIRITLSSQLNLQDSLTFGELAIYPSPLKKAVLMITEDDQWANFDTNGTPSLRKYGFPATVYANAGLFGVANKMNLDRLKTLQDSGGWTIGSHLWTHDSITALTNDSADRSLKMNAQYLRDHGFTGYQHFAYPYGRSDRAKDSVVRLNALTARLVIGWPGGEPIPFSDPYRLRILGFLANNVTLDMAKGAIKLLVENQTSGILGVHEIVNSGVLNGNKWYRSDWEALMEYIHGFVLENKLEVISLEAFTKVNQI